MKHRVLLVKVVKSVSNDLYTNENNKNQKLEGKILFM